MQLLCSWASQVLWCILPPAPTVWAACSASRGQECLQSVLFSPSSLCLTLTQQGQETAEWSKRRKCPSSWHQMRLVPPLLVVFRFNSTPPPPRGLPRRFCFCQVISDADVWDLLAELTAAISSVLHRGTGWEQGPPQKPAVVSPQVRLHSQDDGF